MAVRRNRESNRGERARAGSGGRIRRGAKEAVARANGPARDESLKDRRRRQIIDATIDAIYRRGIGETRLADVARAAGVSYGVVSFYFRSKDALLLETMNHVAHEYEAALRAAVARPAESAMARLLTVVDVNFTRRVAEPRKTAVWVAAWAHGTVAPTVRRRGCELQEDYVRLTEPICRQLVTEGGYRSVDPREIAAALCALMSGFDVEMHLRRRGYSAATARRTCHALLAALFPREYAAATERRNAAGGRAPRSGPATAATRGPQ
ncbi:MAG: TetR family transcriptional regulator C-terminal domain-containing protein [Dongiaceae bacterium]